MSSRLPYFELSSTPVRKLYELSQTAHKESIEAGLRHLVDIRASQINGCAFCVDMHVKQATIAGERPLRLHHVAIWRESPLFSERERMALEWTEAVTHISTPGGIPDALYEKARTVFSDKELSDLTVLVGIINTWNRLAVAFRAVPGSNDQQLGIANSGLV
ncbi:carboxymuconolactone decarboxylase family protein [Pendulispora rubella]|uniref:Carboxymuconolactone decarboxylase family protein n=1 Tax=Pendulispora rubella TaxID=2741070 RepID=A0ABZ2LG86_9BACT